MKQIHYKSLHRIVIMVPQCNFVAAELLGRIVQRSAAHPGAQAAGIGFFSGLEHNRPNFRFQYMIRHSHTLAHLPDRPIVGALPIPPWIQCDANQLKWNADKFLQSSQSSRQRNRILSAADSHSNPIARFNHPVFLNGFAHIPHNPLHIVSRLACFFSFYFFRTEIATAKMKIEFKKTGEYIRK